MKVLVTGACGQLGQDVVKELIKRDYNVIGTDIFESFSQTSILAKIRYISLDIINESLVYKTIKQLKPDVVIHCAAWTNVDLAEEIEQQKKVYKINVDGTKNIVKICREINCKFVYMSTDYVFDGSGTLPRSPDSFDFNPINIYGKTKLEGEYIVSDLLKKYFIVRISWVFGKNGKNFVNTMLKLGKTKKELYIVDDQIGTPTYTVDLSRILVDLIETDKFGYYHISNEGGYISWYEFAKEIFKQAIEAGHEEYREIKIYPVTTVEYGLSVAKRPYNSRLDKSKLIKEKFKPLPTWKDALFRYLEEIDY